MKKSNSTLFLESSGSVSMLQLIDGQPDFTPFYEPSLSILQKAWLDFLESGQEIEIIPDPDPIDIKPIAQWVSFNMAISLDHDMINYETIANQRHPSIVSKKDLAYSMIETHGIDNFAFAYSVFCQIAEVTQQHKDKWADMAEVLNLPADFVALIRS